MVRTKGTVLPVLICLLFLLGISVRMTAAFMTDHTEPCKNNFTAGNVDIQLREDNWNESDAEKIHPLQSVQKDPLVSNVGSHPAYVFIEVYIPVKRIRMVDEYGKKTDEMNCELFSFIPELTKWSLIQTQELEDCKQYVFGYQDILEPGNETVPLFQSVTSVNYLEGELDPASVYSIDIQTKAIQSQLNTENMTLFDIYQLLENELPVTSA